MLCHYGLIIYGDLRPFSQVAVDRRLFTSDASRFLRTLERLSFSGGNPLRNCVSEGLTAAVDVRARARLQIARDRTPGEADTAFGHPRCAPPPLGSGCAT